MCRYFTTGLDKIWTVYYDEAMKLLFQMIKPRENIISRAVHGITKQKYSGGRFAENQFKELMKKNLSVPVTLYHL